MLEDREYMRQPDYHSSRISFTVLLLVVNAVAFLVQLMAGQSPRGSQIEAEYFALSVPGLAHGHVWELLTYQFMHGGWMHLIFNSLAIFFFGRSVESVIGGAKFLTLYFLSGVVGGIVQMLFALVLPETFGGLLVGASAGGFGLVGAFAVMNWEQPFTLILYFVPVTMRGKTLFLASIIIAIIGMVALKDGIAHAAHLGGIVTGFLYARRFIHGNWTPPSTSRRGLMDFLGRKPGRGTVRPDRDVSAEEFLQKEVDPILEKISAHGIQSLTARERQILEAARSKMEKR